MNTIFTIGHSTHSIEDFINLLKLHNINYIMDVRSIPYSKYIPHFNRESISSTLTNQNINYKFLGDVFGAKVKDITLYNEDGVLDFDKVRQTPKFITLVDNLILGINQGNKICLMCSEKDPTQCHRSIMISRSFYDKDIQIAHILSNGSIMSQDNLHQNILSKCKTDNLDLAFKIMNNKIGNKIR